MASGIITACVHGRVDDARSCLTSENINQPDGDVTPFYAACAFGHVDVATLLLDRGADVHWANQDGWTGHIIACLRGRIDVMTLCLDRGADVRHVTQNGTASIHIACQNNLVDIVRLCLDRGTDVDCAP